MFRWGIVLSSKGLRFGDGNIGTLTEASGTWMSHSSSERSSLAFYFWLWGTNSLVGGRAVEAVAKVS